VVTIGSLIAFITVLNLVAKNVYDYARGDLPLLAAAGRTSRAVDDLLQAPIVVTDPSHRTALPPIEGTIRFDNVNFSYAPGKPALSGVSFEIPARRTVAVVGPNGSGKSTLLSLLIRLYDPEEGSITVDGQDLRQVTQHSFRSQMAVVMQDNFVFNDTIRENIRVGAPGASDEDTVLAAKRADLHEFVMSLPEGYDTVVGESGGRLSRGHRQRLAIARAMIRDPRVLLLDEVTTALDPATEMSIHQMLARAGEERTVISVTHRLAATLESDEILVFDHGTLVERGRHGDLHAAGGVYRRLWEKQSGFDVSHDGRHAMVDAARLRQVALFADLGDDTLTEIAGRLKSEYYEAGQQVFAEGEVGDRFYLIARGQVAVLSSGPDGADHVLEVLGDGDHFGELALIDHRPRSATIRTETPSVLLTMGREEFLRQVVSTPEMLPALEGRMARSRATLDAWHQRETFAIDLPQ
jgi:ATP-binding cassette subfamily B protein